MASCHHPSEEEAREDQGDCNGPEVTLVVEQGTSPPVLLPEQGWPDDQETEEESVAERAKMDPSGRGGDAGSMS
jgi:hypothetical protein